MVTLMVVLIAAIAHADNSGRIYGKITTVDGDTFEGLIRWDKNEASWVDILNGNKELEKRHKRDKDKRRKYHDRDRIEIFGIEFGGTNVYYGNSAQSGVRFGHIRSLEVVDDDAALITLKSGEQVELSGGSTDIGESIRELVIEDESEGEIELVWDDIDRVDFEDTDGSQISSFGDRLYGTLTTRRGDEFTGFVCWDVDEVLTDDILDGEDRRRTRKIQFGKIKAIERYSSNGATIYLENGDEVLLRGTNDIDDGNRGIIISDPGFGQVTVKWDEFERLDFKEAPNQIKYNSFDGGKPLRGTVYTEDGESYTGLICWDNDEKYTWEILDGDYRDIEFDIELGYIAKIEKRSYRSSLVTIKDGRTFRLKGSNDVDEDNKGIYITLEDGDEVAVYWDEFERVEFSQ